ncbi:response regulator transcription factor [Clostridium lacusfryxellense]|uniref:response regulator transcription factor n=1 Tax=Clostridium lacusfryxellense TaxID=205328 RepID=UPI001C0DA0FC|nr:response regulator [Clostridium lacusfryxellense]MBU3114177.1 response regulator [Clostridium lacusfryxellense]
MYKLLIADDESRIRRGIKNSLDWSKLNIEVVGEAEDGEIALKQIKKLKPDLMFLDICMPFLNGMELIKKLNGESPDCIIIIITGHDEFEYMHEALKLKVFDYLLKPVQKDALLDTVNRAMEELRKNNQNNVYLDLTNRQLDENIDMLKQTFISNWFNGSYTDQKVLSELKFFKFNLDSNIGIVIIKVIERLNYKVYSKDWDRDLLNFALTNVTLELLNKTNPEITYIDEDNNIVIICNVKNISEWVSIGNEIVNKIYTYLNYIAILEQRIIKNGIYGTRNAYNDIISNIKRTSEYKPVVLLAIRHIDVNYYLNDFSLGDVAEKFSVSSSYLSKLLKHEVGLSFIDYLTMFRIKKSICMMDDPRLKIYEIARAVGYNNQHYFCKAFKKVMGVAPTEYRGGGL